MAVVHSATFLMCSEVYDLPVNEEIPHKNIQEKPQDTDCEAI